MVLPFLFKYRARLSLPSFMTMSPRLSSTVSTGSVYSGSSLADLPKSNVFTMNLPSDPDFPSPEVSYKAPRDDLGPRTVKGALYTYVRPERAKKAELLAVSNTAMRDIGLRTGEEETTEFQDLVAGSKIFWDEMTGEGIYPWAQCYGGKRAAMSCMILSELFAGWQLYEKFHGVQECYQH